MGRRGIFKKFLLILLFAVFLNAGYWTVSRAQQAPLVIINVPAVCAVPCIFPGTFAAAIAATGISITTSIGSITAAITAKFTPAAEDFTQTISDKIGDATDNIVKWIDTFWTHNLMKAMQLQTNQIVTMTAGQSRDIALITNAANYVRAVLDRQEEEIRNWREHNASSGGCVAATVSGGMTRSSVLRRAYSAAAPGKHLGRSANSAESGSVSPAADMKDRWETYKTRYCEKDFNNGASGCENDQPFAGQDIDVAGTIFAKDTIDITNPDTKKTVDDLVINIAEPFIKEAVPATAVNSPTGQAAILEGEAYKAKRQTIYDSLYYIISRRTPGSGLKDYIAPLRDKAGIDPSLVSANPSYNEIMQVMMNERFRSDSGRVETPENTDREMVIQQAFQVMQMSDQLDLMDHYALVLAAQVGAEIRKNKDTGSAMSGAPVK